MESKGQRKMEMQIKYNIDHIPKAGYVCSIHHINFKLSQLCIVAGTKLFWEISMKNT